MEVPISSSEQPESRRPIDKGSRRQIIDWVASANFLPSLNELLSSTGARVGATDNWMPRSRQHPNEARLEYFPPANTFPDAGDWQNQLRDWWLRHPRGANTSNWDFASTYEIDGRKGLVLVEAKSHKAELSESSKVKSVRGDLDAQRRSDENHDSIGEAIGSAGRALNAVAPGTALSAEEPFPEALRRHLARWFRGPVDQLRRGVAVPSRAITGTAKGLRA